MKSILNNLLIFGIAILLLNAGPLKAQFTEYEVPYANIVKMIDGEQFKAAEKEIASKLTTNAKDANALYCRGYMKYILEDFDGAITAHQEGIKARSKYPFNHIGLANAYSKKGMAEEASAAIEQAIKVNKKGDHNVLIQLADAYLVADKKKEAEIVLYRVREENADDPRPYVGLGWYNVARGVDELAKTYFIQGIEKDPSYIKAYLPLGQISIREAGAVKIKPDYDDAKRAEKKAERRKLFNEGLKYLNKAVELDPTFAPSYKERGELYLKAKMYEQATADYKKYLELLPNDERAQYRYAQFLYLAGNYQESIDLLKKQNVDSYVKTRLMGYSNIELGNLDEGQKLMDAYFKAAPGDKLIFQDFDALAKLEMQRENYPKAIENFNTMLSMRGDEDKCEFFLDKAKQYKKDKEYGMESIFRKAVIDCGGARKLKEHFNWGFAAYRGQRYQDALEAFQACTEIKDDWETGWYYLGSTKYQMSQDTTNQYTVEMEDPAWPALTEYRKVYELLQAKPVGELKRGEKSHLTTSTSYLAFYAFSPVKKAEPKPEDYHCDDAQPYISKVLELDPANKQVTQITDYCEQVKAAAGGK